MALATGTFAGSEARLATESMQVNWQAADGGITGPASGCEVRYGSISH
ncbi:MAG TPA: hypothetical protein VMA32_11795 [Streptosporangiaceae bacterium]|nr:hypothetical protein [Streptosporangiaceae bacterium]